MYTREIQKITGGREANIDLQAHTATHRRGRRCRPRCGQHTNGPPYYLHRCQPRATYARLAQSTESHGVVHTLALDRDFVKKKNKYGQRKNVFTTFTHTPAKMDYANIGMAVPQTPVGYKPRGQVRVYRNCCNRERPGAPCPKRHIP